MVVEATSSYEWFLLLVEDLADRCVLAHPKKLRVIAESKHKSDKIDAQVLAEFLLLDMIPEAYRPSPRVRQHRVLVRHRDAVQRQITGVKCKLRHKAAFYNADIASLFTVRGLAHLAKIAMSHADRFECQALRDQLQFLQQQLKAVDQELRTFAETAPVAEREARAILASVPEVGPVTTDVILSEAGDVRRFRGSKRIVAYAGLDPGIRESAGKGKQLSITKEGSRLLRWALNRNRLAAGEKDREVAAALRAALVHHRTQKEGHRWGGPTIVMRPVCHAPRWAGLPLGGLTERHSSKGKKSGLREKGPN